MMGTVAQDGVRLFFSTSFSSASLHQYNLLSRLVSRITNSCLSPHIFLVCSTPAVYEAGWRYLCPRGRRGENIVFSASLYLLLEQGNNSVARLKGDGHAKVHWDWLVQSKNTTLVLWILWDCNFSISWPLQTIGNASVCDMPLSWNPCFTSLS